MKEFKVGQFVAYIAKDNEGNIYKIEIGQIKSLGETGAFVYYHSGSTAAKTDYKYLYEINNDQYLETTLLNSNL